MIMVAWADGAGNQRREKNVASWVAFGVSALIVIGFSLVGFVLVVTGSHRGQRAPPRDRPDHDPTPRPPAEAAAATDITLERPPDMEVAKALGASALIIIGFTLGGLVLAIAAFDAFTHGYLHLMFLGFPLPWIMAKAFELHYPVPTLFSFGMLQFFAYGLVFEGTHRLFKISRWKCWIPVVLFHVGVFLVAGSFFP